MNDNYPNSKDNYYMPTRILHSFLNRSINVSMNLFCTGAQRIHVLSDVDNRLDRYGLTRKYRNKQMLPTKQFETLPMFKKYLPNGVLSAMCFH